MTTIQKFEDLQIWQKARDLSLTSYKLFNKNKDYGFRDQIQRASVSVMNNIAEGFERHGNKEFTKFLYISKGSCGEVRSMLYLALDLKYISTQDFTNLNSLTVEISGKIGSLIKKVNV
jgi:four helix bundle protein